MSSLRIAVVSAALVAALTSCGASSLAVSVDPAVTTAAPTASTARVALSTPSSSVAPSPAEPPTTPGGPALPAPEIRSGALADLPAAPAPPVRLRIPRIAVDAPVVGVAIKPGTIAELDVPGIRSAGWYRLGSVPGAAGSAVIAGHVDGEGRRAVFWDLRKLEAGDAISVAFADGTERAFRVVSRQQVAKQELPAELFRRDGAATLALVTCGGSFDRRIGHYRDNVVVMATPA